jgi:hypothetical protein
MEPGVSSFMGGTHMNAGYTELINARVSDIRATKKEAQKAYMNKHMAVLSVIYPLFNAVQKDFKGEIHAADLTDMARWAHRVDFPPMHAYTLTGFEFGSISSTSPRGNEVLHVSTTEDLRVVTYITLVVGSEEWGYKEYDSPAEAIPAILEFIAESLA